MNALRRLSNALAGQSTLEPPQSLQTQKSPSADKTTGQVVPPTPRPPRAAAAPTGAPTLLTANNRTQSVRAWSNQLAPSGPSEATIHYRLKQGWTDPQALGLSPPPPRDRTREQAGHALAHARVVIYELSSSGERVVLSRAEVARRLRIKLKSVAQKLRAHRPADGGQAWIEYRSLEKR